MSAVRCRARRGSRTRPGRRATGYGLTRALLAAGIGCVVAAPGKIERPAQDRVKTDQRDAERVLRLLMIDALHAVRVPSSEEEALRDLVRAREVLRGDLMRARQRMGKLLLRHDVRYAENAGTWSAAHRAWLRKVDLGQRGAQATLLDYLGAVDALVIRRDALEATLSAQSWSATRRGRRRSPDCGACAGSTRSQRSGCAPRSAATFTASSGPSC